MLPFFSNQGQTREENKHSFSGVTTGTQGDVAAIFFVDRLLLQGALPCASHMIRIRIPRIVRDVSALSPSFFSMGY